MGLDEHCRNTKSIWSVIVAAPADAAFAGLLTGFMISAIAFLLGRERQEDKILHAVALFAPGLLVLALACNQFVGITAIAPNMAKEADPQTKPEVVCSVAWTQGMTAQGMLGVGFVVAVAGLVWMMAHAVDGNIRDDPESGGQDRRTLIHLGNFLVFVAVATVSLLLTNGSVGYYDMMGTVGVHPPNPSKAAIWWTFGIMILVDAAIISVRTAGYYLVRHKRIHGKWEGRGERRGARYLRRGFIVCVVVLTAGLALMAPLHAGLVSQGNSVPGNVAAFFAVALGMFYPFVIFLFISASVPGPDFWYWDINLRYQGKTRSQRLETRRPAAGFGSREPSRSLIRRPTQAKSPRGRREGKHSRRRYVEPVSNSGEAKRFRVKPGLLRHNLPADPTAATLYGPDRQHKVLIDILGNQ